MGATTMNVTGGGLLQSGRTQPEPPQPRPVGLDKPPASAQPQQSAPPAGQVPQAGQAPQGQPQGQPQGGPPAPGPGPEAHNDLMNNALRLLHDPQAAPEFESMIAQGEKGAAHAAVTIGEQVINAHNQNGAGVDDNMVEDAITAIVDDITAIGLGNGSLQPEPMINGEPASKMAVMAYASETWAQKFPEFAAGLAQVAQQGTPQDDAAAQQLAQYLQSSGQQPAQGQPQQAAQPTQQPAQQPVQPAPTGVPAQ